MSGAKSGVCLASLPGLIQFQTPALYCGECRQHRSRIPCNTYPARKAVGKLNTRVSQQYVRGRMGTVR